MFRILVINPGSTTTKVAVYDDVTPLCKQTVSHPAQELAEYQQLLDQFEFRKQAIMEVLQQQQVALTSLNAIVGRGGLVYPLEGGCYAVNDRMVEDLRAAVMGEHASNLGALLARVFGAECGIPAYIVDPVVVDELEPLARYSGLPQLPRQSIFHALNQKAVARRVARELGKSYAECNFIVAHLGGGISVGAHKHGRVVDVNNALDGDGPFTPERSGSLPAGSLVRLCFSREYSQQQIKKCSKDEAV
jgi:butyrate kinase